MSGKLNNINWLAIQSYYKLLPQE